MPMPRNTLHLVWHRLQLTGRVIYTQTQGYWWPGLGDRVSPVRLGTRAASRLPIRPNRRWGAREHGLQSTRRGGKWHRRHDGHVDWFGVAFLNEETHVHCCTALGGVAGRSTITTTAPGGRRPDKHIATTNTGVICIEEMTATFCNVPTSPSHGGYGSSGFVGSSAASGLSAGSGVSGPTSRAAPSGAIPTCPEFPPANELCN